MDVVLEAFDRYVFDWLYAAVFPREAQTSFFHASKTARDGNFSSLPPYEYHPASQFLSFGPTKYAYMSRFARDDAWRQAISLFLITWLFGLFIYFFCSTLSYIFVFDKETFKHPKYLKNQIRMEISQSVRSMPVMSLLTVPFFLAEVRGYSKIYDATAQGPGRWYDFLQFPLFFAFTDFGIYYIHRGLHHPAIYKHMHKSHHKWIMPTPFASFAFHPVDGYLQSVPYHIFPFVFPLQKFAYILLFAAIQVWTVLIHDGEYAMNNVIINGAACHTMHHLYFNYNYGQFTTLWDRLGGSYRKPNDELFKKETKMSKEEWLRQKKEMERIVVEVEGEDDRTYLPAEETKKVQ